MRTFGGAAERHTRRHSRLTAVLVGVILASLGGFTAGAAATIFAATPASAHATLESTDPAAGAALRSPPTAVTLRFDEQVEVSFGSVRVYDAKAKRVDEGDPSHPTGDTHAVRLAVPRLASGTYVVTWRVTSADSHPVHGAFTFRIGAGNGADTTSLAHRLLNAQGGSALVGTLFAIDRFLAFASVLVLIGGTVFVLGAWTAGRRDRRARRVLSIAWVGAVITALLGISLQGLYAGALPLSKLLDPSLISGVLDTRFGKVWLARAVLLVLLAPLLRIMLRSDDERPAPVLVAPAAVGGIALAASFGLAGHPGTGSMVPLAVLSDTSHVAAASVWIGGLFLLTTCVLFASSASANAGPVARRFSPIAFWAVIVIATSGLYQGWRQVGSIDALLHTTYGRLLSIKVILFAGLIALAAVSRSWVRRGEPTAKVTAPSVEPAPTPILVGVGSTSTPSAEIDDPGDDAATGSTGSSRPPEQLRTVRRSVAAEVCVAVAVLVMTSLLVNAQPGRTALAQPFSTELETKSLLIDVTIDPAKVGETSVHLYTLSPEGAVKDVKEITAQMELPGRGIAPIDVPLRRAGPGHFAAYGFDLPIAGHWQLTVKALVSDFDEAAASAMVHVR